MSITIEQDLKEILDRFERKLDKLTEDVNELKLGQVEIKDDIRALDEKLKGINTRLDKVEVSMQKIPELAEKVGEVKNWRTRCWRLPPTFQPSVRQISSIIVSATIAAILGYFVRSGKL